MNAKDSYEVHVEARRARSGLQSELLAGAAMTLVQLTRYGWVGFWSQCRRVLRLRDIAEA
jgi:hypothetical protein